MPGVNAPNEAGVPSVSDSVAGTVPPTSPGTCGKKSGSMPTPRPLNSIQFRLPKLFAGAPVAVMARNTKNRRCEPEKFRSNVWSVNALDATANRIARLLRDQDIAKKLNLPVSDCMDKIVPAFQKQIDPNIQTVDEALIFMINRIKADHETKKTQEMRKKVDASQSDLQSRPDVLRDHKGRCFNSKSQMARYHGLSHATLRFRLEQDMDLQEALTKPVRQPGCTDHEGRRFDTVHEMAAWYGIKYATLEQRLGSGMPLDKALTTLPPNTVIDDELIVLSNIEGPYYNVLFRNKEDIWTHHQILTYLHQHTPAQE